MPNSAQESMPNNSQSNIHCRTVALYLNRRLLHLKLLKTKSRTKTELLKVSSARRRARQAALDALLAEGNVIRIDRKYFANDPSGSVW